MRGRPPIRIQRREQEMKFMTTGTIACAVCLIALMLLAGCTSTNAGDTPAAQTAQQTAAAQVTPSSPPSPQVTAGQTDLASENPDAAGLLDTSGEASAPDQQAVTMASDTPAVPSGVALQQTLSADHEPMGDILP